MSPNHPPAQPIRAARLKAHMSQEHLALAAGVSEKTVRRAERGLAVSAESMRALCAALGIEAPDVPRGVSREDARRIDALSPRSPWAPVPGNRYHLFTQHSGALLRFRDIRGKDWAYRPASSLQVGQIDLVCGPPASGKSALAGMFSLAMLGYDNKGDFGFEDRHGFGLVRPLPTVAAVTDGPGSEGWTTFTRETLPPEERHRVRLVRLTHEDRINPFDTPLGCRRPLPCHREALVNLLCLVGTGEDNLVPTGLPALAGHCVDELYASLNDHLPRSRPRMYAPGADPQVDAALRAAAVTDLDGTWWDVVDRLFDAGDAGNALRAQRHAVPTFRELADILRHPGIDGRCGHLRHEGEGLLAVFGRMVQWASNAVPLLSGPSSLDLGGARVVVIDAEAVMPRGGHVKEKKAAIAYLLARQAAVRDVFHRMSDATHEDYEGPFLEPRYHRHFHDHCCPTDRHLVLDDIHRVDTFPSVRAQVLSDMRECRRLSIAMTVTSQMPGSFSDDHVALATGVWCQPGTSRSYVRDAVEVLGVAGEAIELLTHRTGEDGPSQACRLVLEDRVVEAVLAVPFGERMRWIMATREHPRKLKAALLERMPHDEMLDLLLRTWPTLAAFEEECDREYFRLAREEQGAGDDRPYVVMLRHCSDQAPRNLAARLLDSLPPCGMRAAG